MLKCGLSLLVLFALMALPATAIPAGADREWGPRNALTVTFRDGEPKTIEQGMAFLEQQGLLDDILRELGEMIAAIRDDRDLRIMVISNFSLAPWPYDPPKSNAAKNGGMLGMRGAVATKLLLKAGLEEEDRTQVDYQPDPSGTVGELPKVRFWVGRVGKVQDVSGSQPPPSVTNVTIINTIVTNDCDEDEKEGEPEKGYLSFWGSVHALDQADVELSGVDPDDRPDFIPAVGFRVTDARHRFMVVCDTQPPGDFFQNDYDWNIFGLGALFRLPKTENIYVGVMHQDYRLLHQRNDDFPFAPHEESVTRWAGVCEWHPFGYGAAVGVNVGESKHEFHSWDWADEKAVGEKCRGEWKDEVEKRFKVLLYIAVKAPRIPLPFLE